MNPVTENKIVLVVRQTRLDDLVTRYNTEQARFYVEHLDADFEDYLDEDRTYKESVAEAESILRGAGRLQTLHRRFLPNFVFGEDDLVVVLGQDGLVANTIKYLEEQQVIGVNPDIGRWDGVLLPYRICDLNDVVMEVIAQRQTVREVTLAKASLTNGQVLHAVNDLYLGSRTHVSSRYRIQIGREAEDQSSSGIIVSTGVGSTGWFKSILAGVAGVADALGEKKLQLRPNDNFTWESEYLYYTVREPYPSASTGAKIVFGKVTPPESLQVLSYMAENGVIFSDGIENDYLEFNSGMQTTITVADKRGRLVV
jgi:NAD kinase